MSASRTNALFTIRDLKFLQVGPRLAANAWMPQARPVYTGQYLFVTRRCSQRQFLLRPDDETNNAYLYCLAEAAERFEIVIILSQMMSNHHHTALFDPHGRHVEFREHFHKMLAKTMNALRGRWENLWATEETCVVELIGREDLMNKLVYIATNPVKDQLTATVRHWPGPRFVHALLTGKVMRAHRPRHFFAPDGSMPEHVELAVRLPDGFDEKESFLVELESRIAEVERAVAERLLATNGHVLGRYRVRRQSWRDSPTSHEPRRNLRPRVAARCKWARMAALQRNREFEREYCAARKRWLAGD